MKQALYFCCAVIWVAQAAHAGEKPAPEAVVAARVEALTEAMVKADGEALKKLTSSNVSYGHSSGRLETREQFIENILNGNSDFLSIKLEDQGIVVADDVAIVRHILSGETHDKGKEPGTVRIGVMLVWQKHKGEWLLLARQAYKLPQ
jgi:hypothetical protein